MNDSVIVGSLVLAGAAALMIYQVRSRAKTPATDAWLHTPTRHRRRMATSLVLLLIGLLILSTGVGILPIEPAPNGVPRITNLTVFVVSVVILSVLLILLAFMDFRETTRAVARHALGELGPEHFEGGTGPYPASEANGEAEDHPIPTTKSNMRLRRAPEKDPR